MLHAKLRPFGPLARVRLLTLPTYLFLLTWSKYATPYTVKYQGIFSHIFNYDSHNLITVALQMSTNVYAGVLAITGGLPARIFPETIAAIAKRVTGIRTPRPVLVSRSMNCKLALCRVLFK